MTPWFAGGLRFSCTQCGNCCTGEPGFVWIGPEEEAGIPAHLGITLEEFRARYTRVVGDRRSLVERPNGDCVFLDADRRCAVHAVKPRQCLVYPFWPKVVASPEAWSAESRKCPGIGTGRLFPARDIETIADRSNPRALVESLLK